LSETAAEVFCAYTPTDADAGKVEKDDPPCPRGHGLLGHGECVPVLPCGPITQRFPISDIEREDYAALVSLTSRSEFGRPLQGLQAENDFLYPGINQAPSVIGKVQAGIDAQLETCGMKLGV
jgi:hypothetical protein